MGVLILWEGQRNLTYKSLDTTLFCSWCSQLYSTLTLWLQFIICCEIGSCQQDDVSVQTSLSLSLSLVLSLSLIDSFVLKLELARTLPVCRWHARRLKFLHLSANPWDCMFSSAQSTLAGHNSTWGRPYHRRQRKKIIGKIEKNLHTSWTLTTSSYTTADHILRALVLVKAIFLLKVNLWYWSKYSKTTCFRQGVQNTKGEL